MGRAPQFDRSAITAAALELVAEGGPRAATIGAIAKRVGAPTGSIYHRFRGREFLLAELWLSVLEGFQDDVLAQLEGDDAVADGVRAAQYVPAWVRAHMNEARLLLLHHREDFVGDVWPEEVSARAAMIQKKLPRALEEFCRRRYEQVGPALLRRVRFALLDLPYGAVRPYVKAGKPPPKDVDLLVAQACEALLR